MEIKKTKTGINCEFLEYNLFVDWYSESVIRVRARRKTITSESDSLSVIARPLTGQDVSLNLEGNFTKVTNKNVSIQISDEGFLSFYFKGKKLLAEKPGTRLFPENSYNKPEDQFGCEQQFILSDDDALYGLGQFPDGIMNWRGHEATLIHGNVTVVVPFLCSTGGWGILWDNPSHTTFSDDENGMRLWSDVADCLDYYICFGDTMDNVLAGYRHLTGAAPLFPKAFYGFIQCKERYKTADELAEIVTEYRKRNLPLDVIVQDWHYWGPGNGKWSSMVADQETYGDIEQAVKSIHEQHGKVMISIWPRIGLESDLGRELLEKGFMFEGNPDSQDKVYDAFSNEAREIYWKHVKKGLFDVGIDAWWMDGTEPEFAGCFDAMIHKNACIEQRDTAMGSWARLLNGFGLLTTQGVYDGQRKTTNEKRVFILTRSAFAGQQRNAAVTWSGDISASWDTFQKQIPAGLNFCMSGIPYWTTDTGAFFVRGRGATFSRGVEDPAYCELYLRWFQYSVFCPIMRSHGSQTPREIWQFGQPGETIYDTLEAFDCFRMRLLPYTYSLAGDTTLRGGSLMRGLAMDFPDDSRVHSIKDQFMYGKSLMACPVTQPLVHFPTDRLNPVMVKDDGGKPDNSFSMDVYDGIDAKTPSFSREYNWRLDFSWQGNPPVGATSNSYRIELAGHIAIPVSEPYEAIIFRAAGRLCVELNGAKIIDEWEDLPLREHRIPFSEIDSEVFHLKISYGHIEGDSVIQAGWEMPITWNEKTPDHKLEKSVYLPDADWYDFWTGKKFNGGNTISTPSPLEIMPLFVPSGTILPLGPVKMWHDEKPDDPIELRIYPGKDGAFTLYEDSGDGYDYENGEYSEIRFSWDDAAGILTIGERSGSFEGMRESRTFNLVMVKENYGIGIDSTEIPTMEIIYDGSEKSVELEK